MEPPDQTVRRGGCACGAVRFETHGDPLRVGLCHCLTCRKRHGGAFNPFVVFARERVGLSGLMHGWESSPGQSRDFCPSCGSPVVILSADEAELSLGSFDEVDLFARSTKPGFRGARPGSRPCPSRSSARTAIVRFRSAPWRPVIVMIWSDPSIAVRRRGVVGGRDDDRGAASGVGDEQF